MPTNIPFTNCLRLKCSFAEKENIEPSLNDVMFIHDPVYLQLRYTAGFTGWSMVKSSQIINSKLLLFKLLDETKGKGTRIFSGIVCKSKYFK